MPSRATLQPMSIPRQQAWTKEQFLAWAEAQNGRYEFDGIRPVVMTVGNTNHAIIMRNLHRSLDSRLHDSRYMPLGLDAGLDTIDGKIRYPDALITRSKQVGTAKTVTGVIIVFEIVSPGSAERDRITKVKEYAAVPSILHYIIIESTSKGLLALHHQPDQTEWRAEASTETGMLVLPEIGIRFPIAELYDNVDLGDETEAE